MQTALAAAVSALTLWYTVRAWLCIRRNAAAVLKRGMISQQRQVDKRIAEERKWLHLTVAIIVAFMISVVPVFFFYVASLLGLRSGSCVPIRAKKLSHALFCPLQVAPGCDPAGLVAPGVGLLPQPHHLHPAKRQHAPRTLPQLARAGLQGRTAPGGSGGGRGGGEPGHQGHAVHHDQQAGGRNCLVKNWHIYLVCIFYVPYRILRLYEGMSGRQRTHRILFFPQRFPTVFKYTHTYTNRVKKSIIPTCYLKSIVSVLRSIVLEQKVKINRKTDTILLR